MARIAVSQIGQLIEEYGLAQGASVSGWTTSFSKQSCMVSGITTSDEARAVGDFLMSKGMLTELVSPTQIVPGWGVVAVPL